ncbi:DUF1643 domain-containing protein [Peribacillus sp. B-H-3]|uniref:DUF1643 domain-containing protein n=1 Tax=Peribacillus sp. B-H-3 TaxID=3400420 RepID=UPI003B01E8AB
MAEISKSGVLLNTNYKDSLIIDKYSSDFKRWREMKLEQLKSENSEDAITWNVFRSFEQIDPKSWLALLFEKSFQKEIKYKLEFIDIHLWKRLNPAINLPLPEGQSEIDIIIESDEFVWFIEAKYKSDISMKTTHDSKRNQVIRNIDVGLDYAKGKDLYFTLLILNDKYSPNGLSIANEYMNSNNKIMIDLPHRIHELSKLRGISILTWLDILNIFSSLDSSTIDEFERVVAKQARIWLANKINYYRKSIPKNGAVFDETRTYRFSLTRVWEPDKEKVVFICLNPSTADENIDDPTLIRCIDFAKRWSNGKYGWLEIVNLFGYRTKDFNNLKNAIDPIGSDNDNFILNAVKDADLVVAAWGENGAYQKRAEEVLKLLSNNNIPIYCLDILNGGQPKHPLYVKATNEPSLYFLDR